MRVFLYISYDGSKFQGFASQPNKNTILDKLTFACKQLKISSLPTGSGRTDAGVHAFNQVVHLDIPEFWNDLLKLKNMLNRSLHPFIHVKKIITVDENAHARFSAKKRFYRYICYHGEFNPIYNRFASYYSKINLDEIKECIKLFEGRHDFSFFKKNGTITKDNTREIYKTNIYRYKNFTIFTFLGNGFLRSQIRMIVNSLLEKDDVNKKENIVKQLSKQKKTYTTLSEPNGLYLSRVYYEDEIFKLTH